MSKNFASVLGGHRIEIEGGATFPDDAIVAPWTKEGKAALEDVAYVNRETHDAAPFRIRAEVVKDVFVTFRLLLLYRKDPDHG